MDLINKVENIKGDDISIERFLDIFKEKGLIIIIFILSIPTSMPTPYLSLGGATTPIGLIMMFFGLILLFDSSTDMFPEFILNYKIKKNIIINKKSKSIFTFLDKIKNLFKIKLFEELDTDVLKKKMLLLIIVLSILVAIPLPFTGAIPSMGVTLLTFSYISGNAMLLFISIIISVILMLSYVFLLKKMYGYVKGLF